MGFELRSKTGGAVPGLGAWAETTGNESWKTMAADHELGMAENNGYAAPLGNLEFDEMVNAFVLANNLEIIETE